MIEIIQWTTLACCAAAAAARIPSTIRGENRPLFTIFALMTLVNLLSIQGPYACIDQALGGINLANLLLRVLIFAVIFLMGVRISKGFGAQDAHRLISGPAGLAILAVTSLAVVGSFLIMDTGSSSARLAGVAGVDPWNSVVYEFYGSAGRLYPAYVALTLLPAMVRAVPSRLPLLIRVAAAFLGLGATITSLTLSFPLLPRGEADIRLLVSYLAALCFVAGLALIWGAKKAARRTAKLPGKCTEK